MTEIAAPAAHPATDDLAIPDLNRLRAARDRGQIHGLEVDKKIADLERRLARPAQDCWT